MNSQITFFVCFALAAFFSAMEMAFVSANKIKLRELADSGVEAAGKILRLQQDSQIFLTVILIGNNIMSTAAVAVMAYWLESTFHLTSEWLITAIMAPLLIIFAETVPKDYGRLNAQRLLLKYADALTFWVKIFQYPAGWLLKIVQVFLKPFQPGIDKGIFVSEREFRLLIEETAKTGILAHHEKKLVDTILDFERIHVDSVMIPLEKTAKVELGENVGKVKSLARETGARMVVVYEEDPSIVVGMVYVFDLLFEKDETKGLRSFLRSPIFLPKATSIEKAFLTMQEKRQSFAAVTDQHHEVIGIIAIEKLFVI